MKPYIILFDVDGVLADHRPYNYLYEESDLDSFHDLMPGFDPIPAGVVTYNMLVTQAQIIGHAIQGANLEHEIPFVDIITCRPEKMRDVTIKWMDRIGLLPARYLHMRADDDFRSPEEIKLEMYEKHYKEKEEVLCLYEDNENTVKAFRDLGITVYSSL